MPHPAHPQASLSNARGNCAQIPSFLQTLLALIAALLGRPRARALTPAWHTLSAHEATPWHDEGTAEVEPYAWSEGQYWSPLTHNHADCDPRILYVIGPRPNRGLRPLPRKTPIPRPRTARAPPPPSPASRPTPSPQKTTPTAPANPRPKCSDIVINYQIPPP